MSLRLDPGFDEVLTVTDYYDGPRQGIANLGGHPHFYDRIFDEARQDYSHLYRLTPVPPELLALALEDWAIWERWEKAFHEGRATTESHPALPQDRDRHLEIKFTLDAELKTDVNNSVIRAGSFAIIDVEKRAEAGRDLRVKWLDEETKTDSIWTR